MDYTISQIRDFFRQEFGKSYIQTAAVTLGLFEFDDIINNTLGAVAGLFIYKVCRKIIVFSQ